MSNRFLEIAVSNKTSDSKMSFHKGIANLIFQVPSINATLIPGSVRIVGKLRFYKDDEDPPTAAGGVETADERLGVYGAFQSLTTRSIKHQQTIENIRHYAHFLKNFLPLATSETDADTHWSQSNLELSNFNLFKNYAVQMDAENEFCVPLPCGLFNGTQDIPLGENMLGGLEVVLALASDSQMIYSNTGVATSISTAWYEFSDLKMVCEVRDYAPDELSRLMKKASSGFTYQSISSYYDTINSQSASVVFNLGLSKVRSVFTSFIPSSYLNNYGQNSYATLMPSNSDGTLAAIQKVVWTKGGTMYPKMYELNTNIRDSPKTINCDPVVVKDYVSAVKLFHNNDSIQLGDTTTNRDVNNSNNATDNNQLQYHRVPNGGYGWGLGITYDHLGGQGADFSNPGSQFGMNMDLDLTTNSPQSCFIFVNSEVNVLFNQNGIQVIQ